MAAPAAEQQAVSTTDPAADARPRLGLIVNPIAGMGGAVALKGTDDRVEEARARGAEPVAHDRAVRFLRSLRVEVDVLTCSGPMGAEACQEAEVDHEVVQTVEEPTSAEDTRAATRGLARAGVDLLCFLGGDGTAMDIAQAADQGLVCLGVPTGVKMNSGVFAETPETAAEIVRAYLIGDAPAVEGEVVEIDEAALDRGEIDPVRLDSLRVPRHEAVAPNKAHPGGTVEGLAEAIEDQLVPGSTWVLGGGSTVLAIKQALVGSGTLLGVDVIEVDEDGRPELILEDITAQDVADLPDDTRLVVSPIGGQGFVVGRGTQQVSPGLLTRIGWDNLIVVATAEKLQSLDHLRADSGDPALDEEAPANLRVVTGPGFRHLMNLRTSKRR